MLSPGWPWSSLCDCFLSMWQISGRSNWREGGFVVTDHFRDPLRTTGRKTWQHGSQPIQGASGSHLSTLCQRESREWALQWSQRQVKTYRFTSSAVLLPAGPHFSKCPWHQSQYRKLGPKTSTKHESVGTLKIQATIRPLLFFTTFSQMLLWGDPGFAIFSC